MKYEITFTVEVENNEFESEFDLQEFIKTILEEKYEVIFGVEDITAAELIDSQ